MSKLSIQGSGIMGRPSFSADLFDTLSQANINVRLIATSEIKVSCVIEINNIPKAIRFWMFCQCFKIPTMKLYLKHLRSFVPIDSISSAYLLLVVLGVLVSVM